MSTFDNLNNITDLSKEVVDLKEKIEQKINILAQKINNVSDDYEKQVPVIAKDCEQLIRE